MEDTTSNNSIVKYEEALETEVVPSSDLTPASKINHFIDEKKEILKKVRKASEYELEQLEIIERNTQLANQKREEFLRTGYQNYISDIAFINNIISSHNASIQFAVNRGIQFWKSYDNSNIYYRVNAFDKRKKFNVANDLYSLLGVDIKIYNSIEEVPAFNNGLILISSYLSTVKDDIFYPDSSVEWLFFNNMYYKNTFQYTPFLQKRNLVKEKQDLESQIQFIPNTQMQFTQPQQYPLQPMNGVPVAQQQIQIIQSIQNEWIPQHAYLQNRLDDLSQQLAQKRSRIQDFIFCMVGDNNYNYLMEWLAYFFQWLQKSSRAIVLIGDKETTDILINNIIKPIFAYKQQEYFCTIDDDTLKKSNSIILKNRIFYHIDTDNLTKENIKNPQLSKIVRDLIKSNSLNSIQAIENNEAFIHGELIVTSSYESPYPFLKDSYSRCLVLKVKSISTISEQFNMDQLSLEMCIQDDLDNFSNILAQYPINPEYCKILNNNEKQALPQMKKGILLTQTLENQIQSFIQAIKDKDKQYFQLLASEYDKSLYRQLVANFDNDDAIFQPLLSQYFNTVYGDIIFQNNSDFIDILKERECLFNQAPDDKFKLAGQKRYKIYKYKLAKNYKLDDKRCIDTI